MGDESKQEKVRVGDAAGTLLKSVAIALTLVLVWLIWASNYYGAFTWTGFAASTKPASNVVPGKTLWARLALIVIPATLAAGGFWFNHSQKDREERLAERRAKEERKVADERAQETALQTYLDQMSRLLINYPPRPISLAGNEYEVPEEWSNVARVWTLTILRRLDGERKGIVLSFLYESNLI